MLLNPSQAKALLGHALQNSYAILAVNADSHAAVTDCLNAAKEARSPIIIETSLWQLKGHSYGATDAILGLKRYLADLYAIANHEKYTEVPVIYHTDHIKGPETMDILGAAIAGVDLGLSEKLRASTISLDASDFSESENIAAVCSLCELAQRGFYDLTLEMESAVDHGITPASETELLLGSVEEAYPGYIQLWAPGVGTQHGFTSSDGYSGFNPKVIEDNIKLIRKITGRDFGVALHGSTGLNPEKLTAAAKAGVTKVNWSSESLYIRSMAAKEFVETEAHKFDRSHKDWKNTVMDNGLTAFVSKAYVPKVLERLEILNSIGQTPRFMQTI